jgi:CRISPR-associated exonuclease Cas4
MLGGRDLRATIQKTIDNIYEDLNVKIDKKNNDKIHALESSRCTRLAYYERKDPLPSDNASKISILLSNGMRHRLSNLHGEYKVDILSIEVNADMIIADEYIARFEVVTTLPEIPHPSHLLYLNACLFAFKKDEGLLIYMTTEGKTVEFSVSKNNKMFEEIIRRARVLSTLLKEGKTPIVEPSDLCLSCKYYERCYAREKGKSDGTGDIIAELFGKRKQ